MSLGRSDAEVLDSLKGSVIGSAGIDEGGVLTLELTDGRSLCFANWRGYIALWVVPADREVVH